MSFKYDFPISWLTVSHQNWLFTNLTGGEWHVCSTVFYEGLTFTVIYVPITVPHLMIKIA